MLEDTKKGQLNADLAGQRKCSAVFAGQISLKTTCEFLQGQAERPDSLAVAERQRFYSAHYFLQMEMRKGSEGKSIFPSVETS